MSQVIERIREKIQRVHDAGDDWEAAHGEEDHLYYYVARAYAPADVLVLLDEFETAIKNDPRWYA